MQELVVNERYEIGIEPNLNRLYLEVKGCWTAPEDVPRYVDDLSDAAKRLRPGFTVVTDCTTMRPHHSDVLPVHTAAQEALMHLGLSHVAEVVPMASIRLQTRRLSETTGMLKAEFGSLAEAEAWLDQTSTS